MEWPLLWKTAFPGKHKPIRMAPHFIAKCLCMSLDFGRELLVPWLEGIKCRHRSFSRQGPDPPVCIRLQKDESCSRSPWLWSSS